MDGNTLLLLDSGGQYECGTTDITRTVHMGSPSPLQRMANTRVLQGHIALDTAVFPEGTPGAALDTLARMPLWSQGLNYRHGTGHGVGAALNVHEGPQSISARYTVTAPLQENMVCSNEPGYYEDGNFGVRIENLVVVKEVKTQFRFGGQTYFGFERLTLVPLQAKLMDPSIMTPKEVGVGGRGGAGSKQGLSCLLGGGGGQCHAYMGAQHWNTTHACCVCGGGRGGGGQHS